MRIHEASVPVVSVIIPFARGTDLARAIAALRGQTLSRWEALIVGDEVPLDQRKLLAGDERCVLIESIARRDFEAINLGLERARGEYVMVLDPRDDIAPYALSSLVETARIAGVDGAFGRYVFVSALGVMPGDPLAGAAGQTAPIGIHQLATCKLFPLHAMVMRRAAIGATRMQAAPSAGGDHAFLIQLAGSGMRWSFCNKRVALCTMDDARPHQEILHLLGEHARVIDAALRQLGREAERERALRSHAEAHLLMGAFLRELESTQECDTPDTPLAAAVQFGNLFAQWWQRLRFLGQPPRHVLAASGDIRSSTALSPQRIAQALLEECEPGRPIVLLGLGRNARVTAHALHELGLPIIGRDDGVTGAPGWAAADGLAVEVLDRQAAFDSRSQYIMTLLHDESFLQRLPRDLKVIRWSQASHAVSTAWVNSAIHAMLLGTVALDPPPPSGGLYAGSSRQGVAA